MSGLTNTVGSTVGGIGDGQSFCSWATIIILNSLGLGKGVGALGKGVSDTSKGLGDTVSGAGNTVNDYTTSSTGKKQTGDNPLGL